jgi:hypothetical protein
MIVIPMAGLSRRFAAAGYDKPKYMLEAHGRSLFDLSVLSFRAYFSTHRFLFVARAVGDTESFVRARCAALGIVDWQIVLLDEPTRGQAETVALGLERIDYDRTAPLTIFNIDTFRPEFRYPDFRGQAVDGFLETFVGEGSGWSFVRPTAPGSDSVAESTEKRRISEYCCTGLYHFSSGDDFYLAYKTASALPIETLDGGEIYVAPLYNLLIAEGRDIRFTVVENADVIFCGVPAEYQDVLSGPPLYADLP